MGDMNVRSHAIHAFILDTSKMAMPESKKALRCLTRKALI